MGIIFKLVSIVIVNIYTLIAFPVNSSSFRSKSLPIRRAPEDSS